jgi:pimeloyl-ACP methyl ester carboxylesterase
MADVSLAEGFRDPDRDEGRGPYLIQGLRHAAFPGSGHPDAAVYLPAQIDRGDLAVVVYFHGFENCVSNVIRAAPSRCVPGGPLCPAADLVGHLDRSGRRALLVVPEVAFYARSSDPGALGEQGGLRALLDEVLTALGPAVDGAGVDEVRQVIVVSHSGGYRAAAAVAVLGEVPVRELYLIDSLYGAEDLFDRHVREGLIAYAAQARRFVNLYGESTARRSRAMAGRIAGWLSEAGLPAETLLREDVGKALTEQELQRPILSKRVRTGHSEMPITYLGRLLATSGLPG